MSGLGYTESLKDAAGELIAEGATSTLSVLPYRRTKPCGGSSSLCGCRLRSCMDALRFSPTVRLSIAL